MRHRKMHHANNEKRETTQDGRNRTSKLRKYQNAQKLSDTWSGHNQTSGDEGKKLKRVSLKNEEATRNQTI